MSEQELESDILRKLEIYEGILQKIKSPERREKALSLFGDLAERLATCPASTRLEYVGCYPGGLIEHLINVTKTMLELKNVFKIDDKILNNDSIIITGLLHDLGKLGSKDLEYYLPQRSSWHKEKGILFEINPLCQDVTVATRSVWWIQEHGIKLSPEELSAILSSSPKGHNEISFENNFKEPWLTFILQTAIRASCKQLENIKKTL